MLVKKKVILFNNNKKGVTKRNDLEVIGNDLAKED